MGAKATKLQVDEHGFRPLRKAFRPKHSKQDGNKDVTQQDSVVVHVEAQQEVVPIVALQAIDAIHEKVASASGQQEDTYISEHITSPTACSLCNRLQSSSLVRTPSLSLHNDFNILTLEHASEGGEHAVDIALGADPIGGDD
ncbi:unnamed protein product [Amaranthus hypochondriacus]